MRLAEVKSVKKAPAADISTLEALFAALEEHAVQVSVGDFEDEGKTGTASWSGENGGGDMKFTITPKGVKVEARGEDDTEKLGVFPWQPAKDMALAIDEAMGHFAHDQGEDREDD
jgi:hypothetical protein